MYVLIGSCALQQHGVHLKPNDIDIIGKMDVIQKYFRSHRNQILSQYPLNSSKLFMQLKDKTIFEAEIAWENSSGEGFIQLVKNDKDTIHREDHMVPSLDALYALKMTHKYLKNSPHFLKTMRDIQFMRLMGASIRPEYQEWFKHREKETYSYSHPKLNRSKKEFFNPNEGVQYVYDHDSIHMAVKTFDRPAYDYFKPNTSEVFTSKDLFFKQPEEIRIAAVLEETYVLALERSQIPFPSVDPKWSFDKALEKVCTCITSGWFRAYSYDNYDLAQSKYDPNYVNWLKAGVENGVVKPFEKVE